MTAQALQTLSAGIDQCQASKEAWGVRRET